MTLGGRYQGWLLWALLLFVAAKGAIPAGFMPSSAGFEVCPGGMDPAMAQMVHGRHPRGDEAPSHHGEHRESCVFALSAGGFAPQSASPVSALPTIIAELLRVPAPVTASIRAIRRAQSPRAPPSQI